MLALPPCRMQSRDLFENVDNIYHPRGRQYHDGASSNWWLEKRPDFVRTAALKNRYFFNCSSIFCVVELPLWKGGNLSPIWVSFNDSHWLWDTVYHQIPGIWARAATFGSWAILKEVFPGSMQFQNKCGAAVKKTYRELPPLKHFAMLLGGRKSCPLVWMLLTQLASILMQIQVGKHNGRANLVLEQQNNILVNK